MSSHREFARRLREIVEPLNLKQSKLGEMWGCTQSYAGQILRGDAHPGREIVERIIEAHELPRDLWLARAGYGPRQGVSPEEVDAAELALAAAGWMRSPEFAEALQEVLGDRTIDELAGVLGHKPSFAAAVLRGWHPAHSTTLLNWAGDLDLDIEQTVNLFKAAGYAGWNPLLSFTEAVEGLATFMGVPPPAIESRGIRVAAWTTPREVSRWLQLARDHLFKELSKIPDGFAGFHWAVRLPEAAGGEMVVSSRWETASGNLARSVADARMIAEALPTLAKTIAEWEPIVTAVSELTRMCEERDGPVSFDFRRLRLLTRFNVRDVIEGRDNPTTESL